MGKLLEITIYVIIGLAIYDWGLDGLYSQILLAVLLVVFAIFFVIAPLVELFRPGQLTNSTAAPRAGAFYTEVTPNRTKLVMRGGTTVRLIRGGDGNVDNNIDISFVESPTLLWWVYERYIHNFLGKHPIVPFVHYIWTYPLPRYDVFEEDGKTIFKAIPKSDPRYSSDHVRTQLTTWYFEFKGADVSTIPTTVKGSVQIKIKQGCEIKALFNTDAWNVLLDQALISVVRGVVRAEVTMDQLIGKVAEDLFDDDNSTSAVYSTVQDKILERLKDYKVDGNETLEEAVGLEINRIDIIDFEPELSPEQQDRLYSHFLQRQEARGRHAAGQGEASFQKAVAEVAQGIDADAQDALIAQALLKASAGGQLDALASAFLNQIARK